MLTGVPQAGPIAASVARICAPSGEVAGAGFVVGPRHVATCAHVVSAALGGSPEAPDAPAGRLRVELPLLAAPFACAATVQAWHPIDPETGTGDVAILELADTPTGDARVPPLRRPDRLWGHRFRVLGFPAGMEDGTWTAGELRDRQGTRWLQLETDPHGQPIVRGFSGAPVWDEAVGAVVGMTVAGDVRPGSSTAYLIPIEDVLGVDPGLLPNPYRGLGPFGEEHADLFYGRDDEIDRLEALLDRHPVVAVVGRSGTGKSSLLRAGLVPRLRRKGARIAELRPGPAGEGSDALLDRLAASLGGAPGSTPDGTPGTAAADPGMVLVADQFEDLVGVRPTTEGPTLAQDVLRRLVEMVRAAPLGAEGAPSLRVVLTLRWEAMNELVTGDVVELLDRGRFSLAAMSRAQLRRAVVGPAAHAPGLAFDEGLVDRILDDAVDEPGQLPLVESLLARLWETRDGGTLTLAAYEALGGVRGAVARQAEHAVELLAPADRGPDLRRVLTALARPDDGGGFVRQAVSVGALSAGQRQIVESLARSRLLVVGRLAGGEPVVELAHQALIDHWPRLRDWLDEDREFLHWRHDLERHAQAWERSGHDRDLLLRGGALTRAAEWLGRRGDEVPAPQRAFVDASDRRRRGDLRRRRGLLSAAATVVALVLVLATAVVDQRRDTRREAAISASRSLAARAGDTASSDPALAMMQALAAYENHPTPEAEQALFRLYAGHRGVDTVLSGVSGQILDVAASDDGRVIAAITSQKRVALWIRPRGAPVEMREIGPDATDQGVSAVAVAPDGRGVLVVGSSHAVYYEVATGEHRWEFPVDRDVKAAALRDDGAVALALREENADRLELWKPRGDGARLVAEYVAAPDTAIGLGGFGHQGDTVVVSTVDMRRVLDDPDDRLQIWDAREGALRTVAASGSGKALSPDGSTVAVFRGSSIDGGTVEVLDLRDGTGRTFDLAADAWTDGIPEFDPANEVIVADDGHVLIDARTGEVTPQPVPPYDGKVAAVWSEGDRRMMLFRPLAGTHLVVMELVTRDEVTLGRPIVDYTEEAADFQNRMLLSPDGTHVVSVVDGDRTIAVTELPARGVGFPLVATADRPAPHREPQPGDLVVDSTGSLLADRVTDDLIEVRRLPGLELVGEIDTVGIGPSPPMRFDGDRLRTLGESLWVWWDPETGERVRELDVVAEGIVAPERAGSLDVWSWSAGRLAIVDEESPDILVVDGERGRVVDTITVGEGVVGVIAEAGSSRFMLARLSAVVEIWDAEQQRRLVGPLAVPELLAPTNAFDDDVGLIFDFLPDGSFLTGVGSTEAHGLRLRWYRPGSPTPERALDLGTVRDVIDEEQPVGVSTDGTRLLIGAGRAAPSEIQVVALDLRPEAWRDAVCRQIGGRWFTDDELATMPGGTRSLTPC